MYLTDTQVTTIITIITRGRERMKTFDEDLERAVSFHGHLCGGQMTGVRMARYALRYFDIDNPDTFRDLIVFVECDRCLTDAIMVVTNCHPGKRRMKCLDFGKQAATFYNMQTGEAIRLTNISEKCPKDADLKAWFAAKSDKDLFKVQRVEVDLTDLDLPGKPKQVCRCELCGEQVTDGREIVTDAGITLCRGCAGANYYRVLAPRD